MRSPSTAAAERWTRNHHHRLRVYSPGEVRGRVRPDPDAGAATHAWAGDECRRCRLTRHEQWLLDDEDLPVLVLVWRMPGSRPVGLMVFPRFKGMTPALTPPGRLREFLLHVPQTAEPACPGAPEAWLGLARDLETRRRGIEEGGHDTGPGVT